MNEDFEDLEGQLQGVAPRGAPAELRSRVLDAVAQVLSAEARPPRRSRLSWGVAAAVLFSVGLNVAVGVIEDRRMARIYRRDLQRQDIAEFSAAVASVTNAETGAWFGDYVSRSLATRPPVSRPWPQQELRAIAEVVERG